jgi:type II secretory pathway pseudopilin PulG
MAARVGDLYHSYFVAQEKAVVSLRNTAAPSRHFNDAVASVNQQLWGTWEAQNEAGQSSLLIFTPQGQGFIIQPEPSQPYLALPFQYEVNSSYQPMLMDWVDSRSDRLMTIFEFTANSQLRLELANLNPGNRPSNFTGGGILFTKISNTANLPPNTEVIDLVEQDNKARQVEARNNLGAMNRAQQAYYLEYARFTTTIEELRIGIRSETENYRYRITSGDPRVVAIVTATAKRPGLKSYTGVVWVSPRNGENLTYARLCETNEPSMSAPSITIPTQTNTGVEFQCGNESSEL